MSSVAPRDIVHIGKMALADDIDLLVSHRPGMTELALAIARGMGPTAFAQIAVALA